MSKIRSILVEEAGPTMTMGGLVIVAGAFVMAGHGAIGALAASISILVGVALVPLGIYIMAKTL